MRINTKCSLCNARVTIEVPSNATTAQKQDAIKLAVCPIKPLDLLPGTDWSVPQLVHRDKICITLSAACFHRFMAVAVEPAPGNRFQLAFSGAETVLRRSVANAFRRGMEMDEAERQAKAAR